MNKSKKYLSEVMNINYKQFSVHEFLFYICNIYEINTDL